jgi:hypothetical protein
MKDEEKLQNTWNNVPKRQELDRDARKKPWPQEGGQGFLFIEDRETRLN